MACGSIEKACSTCSLLPGMQVRHAQDPTATLYRQIRISTSKDHGSFLAVWADLSQGVTCAFATKDHVRLCSEVG